MDMETLRFGHGGKQRYTGSHITREICPLDDLRKMGVKTWKQVGRNQWAQDPEGEDLGEFTLRYCNKMKQFSEELANSLREGLSAEVRHQKFAKFTESRLFRKLGPGILFDVLGEGNKSLKDLTFFEIILNRSGAKEATRFSYGEIENRPLYEIILQMERVLNEDEPDLRFPGNEESPVERIIKNAS